jgi:uncharacterized damage-inducible protein DinB
MTDLERLADQFRRAFEGDAWHGASLRELLHGVTAKQAASRPIANAHTIWEIVLHIGSWEKMFNDAIHGKPLLPWPSPAMNKLDWPAVIRKDAKPDAANWKKAQRDLYAAGDKLRRSIAGFEPKRLQEIVPGRDYDFAYAFPGIVQHTIYHAGQIAILRKALTTKDTK